MAKRKISRRDFLVHTAIMATGATLAACVAPAAPPAPQAPQTAESTPEVKSPAAEEPVTLNYWACWSGYYGDMHTNNVLDPFRKEFAGRIAVNYLPVPSNLQQKLVTSAAAGEAPDATTCFGPSVISMGYKGLFMVLNELVASSKRDMSKDKLCCFAAEACVWQGKYYGLPWACDAEMPLFNVPDFQDAGLDPEKAPETWADFTEISKKLVKRDGSGNLTRAAYTQWYPRHMVAWFWINGSDAYDAATDVVTINTPENAEGWQTVIDYAWNVYSDVAQADEFMSGAGTAADSPVCTGGQAIIYDGSWAPNTLHDWCPKAKLWPTPYPHGPKGKQGVTCPVQDGIAVLKDTKHPLEAYTFVEWMSYEGNHLWTKAGNARSCPGDQAGVVPPSWPAIYGDRAQDVANLWDKLRSLQKPALNFPEYTFMNDELHRLFDLALHKKTGVQEALAEAETNVATEIAKRKGV